MRTAAGMGARFGLGEAVQGLVCARLCTHSDQLMMFPMTKSTIRSCKGCGGEVRAGRRGARRGVCRAGDPGASTHHVHGPAALPDAVCVQHMQDPAQDARVCGDRGGTRRKKKDKDKDKEKEKLPPPASLAAVPLPHPASSAPCSRAVCSAAAWPRCG